MCAISLDTCTLLCFHFVMYVLVELHLLLLILKAVSTVVSSLL